MKFLNKNVLIGIGVLVLAVIILHPPWLGAALPLLIFAICPLGMWFMMKGMNNGQGGSSGTMSSTQRGGDNDGWSESRMPDDPFPETPRTHRK